MKISKNTVVKMHYSVGDTNGTTIDSSFDGEPLEFIQGSKFLIEGLENALEGREVGAVFAVTVEADNAYGQRHETLVQKLGKEFFEGFDVEVGMQLRASTDNGEQTVIVVDKTDDSVTVDGNHPLAGLDLVFDCEILGIRAATEQEISKGQPDTQS